jgi:hypothetical protein
MAAVSLGLLLVFAFVPAARPALIAEDRLLEHATAVVFLCGFAAGIVRALARRDAPRSDLLVAVVSLLGCLDEAGFGARRFQLSLPRLRGIEIDGVHDLFLVAYDVFETRNPAFLALYAASAAAGAGALLVLLCSARLRPLRSRLAARFARHAALPFVALAALLLLPALVLDLDLVESAGLSFAEELLELNVAIALLFAGLRGSARERSRPGGRPGNGPSLPLVSDGGRSGGKPP